MRLRIEKISCALTLFLVLAAVFLGNSPLLAAQTPVEIHYWTDLPEIRIAGEIFEQYERDNPGVKVVLGQSAARDLVSDPQRVLCAIVGGDPPDIILFDRYAVGEWAARGAFTCLDDFVAQDAGLPDGIQKGNYYAPCWEEATYQGKLYGIPKGTDDRALFYNKDMLKKKGLVDEKGEARPPRSWAELHDYAIKLCERDTESGSQKLKVVGFAPNWGNSFLYIYGWQNRAKFMSDDGRTCLLNDPSVVQALKFVKSVYDDQGGAEEVYAFQAGFLGDELDPFLTGKIAMKIDGNWFLKKVAQYKPDMNFGVCAAPMANPDDTKISWMGGWAWVIPKGARHPKEAWALIRKLASVQTAEKLAEIEQRTQFSQGRPFIEELNANRKITETLFSKYLKDNPRADRKLADAMQVFIDLLPYSKYRPVSPVGMLLWNQHNRALENAIFAKPGDGMTPQRALDESTAAVQRELDRVVRPETGMEVRWDQMAGAYLLLVLCGAAGILFWFYTRFKGGLQARAEAKAGWCFASPWIVGFIVFTGGPILCSLIMSFCKYDAMSTSRLVGLRNFNEIGNDDVFWKSVWNTAFMMIGVPMGMAFGLGVAMILNANVRGMNVYRTFFYLPAIVPGVASAMLWMWMFNPSGGVLNSILEQAGITGPNWLQDQSWSKPALILKGLWGAGASMIVWLAGLKEIPQDLYEAAAIDGANVFKRFRHITIPMLTPYIFFNLVMGIIGTFQIFTEAYLMTEGGPVDSTLFYAYNLFNHAFRFMHMGYASALAWVLFAIVFALTMFQLQVSKRWVHYHGE